MNLNIMVYIQEIIYLKKDERAYAINLDKQKLIETHWIGLYVNGDNGSPSYYEKHFVSFGAEFIVKEKVDRQKKYHNKHL